LTEKNDKPAVSNLRTYRGKTFRLSLQRERKAREGCPSI